MAKRLDGPYLPGKRSGYWLKIKPALGRRRTLPGNVDTCIAATLPCAARFGI